MDFFLVSHSITYLSWFFFPSDQITTSRIVLVKLHVDICQSVKIAWYKLVLPAVNIL